MVLFSLATFAIILFDSQNSIDPFANSHSYKKSKHQDLFQGFVQIGVSQTMLHHILLSGNPAIVQIRCQY